MKLLLLFVIALAWAGIVHKQVFTHTFGSEFIEITRFFKNGNGCSAQGTGHCGPAYIYVHGSGSTWRPLVLGPDGVNSLEMFADQGVDVWTFVARGMAAGSSAIPGSTFGVDSMVADLDQVTNFVLAHSSVAQRIGVIHMGESLGGNVVFRYNKIHGAELLPSGARKILATFESGGPYNTLDPMFIAMLGLFITLPVEKIPSPLAWNCNPITWECVSAVNVWGELEREMIHYDPTFNAVIKEMLMSETGYLPIGPFKIDFANFTKLAEDWTGTHPQIPVVIFHGYRENVNWTPDILQGALALPNQKTTMYAYINAGHMLFWETEVYAKYRSDLLYNIFYYYNTALEQY